MTEFFKSLFDLLKALIEKPPLALLVSLAVAAWVVLWPHSDWLRTTIGALPAESRPWMGLFAIAFTVWAVLVAGDRTVCRIAAWSKAWHDRQRTKKRLANLAIDERSLLSHFVIRNAPTLDADFVYSKWGSVGYRLRDDGILRPRSQGGELEIVDWVWRHLRTYPQLLDAPSNPAKP